MGAFTWQLRCRAHAPTYYNEVFFDLHSVIVRAELISGQHTLWPKGQPTANLRQNQTVPFPPLAVIVDALG
jgi:hypothetical protein